MKKISNYMLSAFLSLLCITAYSQYPSGFTAPRGIFIITDSAWHKNASVVISRSEISGEFKLLANIRIPSVESEFKSLVKKADADFPVSEAGENTVAKWWDGLNSGKAMSVFMMSPAGMIAAGSGYYDKSAEPGKHYTYRISITAADGSMIKEGTTADILFNSGTGSLPKPVFLKCGENDKVTTVTWAYVPKKVPSFARFLRSGEGEKEFREIPFNGGFSTKGDSVFIRSIDSLVRPMTTYKYIVQAWDWLGNPFPSSDTALVRAWSVYSAPVIRMFYTKPVPEKHAIRLSWPKIDGSGMRGILLLRGDSYGGRFSNIATLPATDTCYVDMVPLANENYWYFAVIANRFGCGLPSTRAFNMVTASLVPLKSSMPKLSSNPKGAEISWTNNGGIIRGYYIYRGEGYRGELKQLTSVIKPSERLSYTDTSVIPGKAYCYAIAALGEGSGISRLSDSAAIMVAANGRITVPYNLRFRNDNTHIMLFWENLVLNDGQVKGYNVYRRTGAAEGFVRLTHTPLSALTNAYTDSTTFTGKTAEYAVVSIGPDGIESPRRFPLSGYPECK